MNRREAIKSRRKIHLEAIDVPEWDEGLAVIRLGADKLIEYDDWVNSHQEGDGRPATLGAMAKLITLTVVFADTHEPVFAEEDIPWLKGESPDLLERVLAVATRLNKIGKQQVEGMEKNSAAGTDADSSSSLPAPSTTVTPTTSPEA